MPLMDGGSGIASGAGAAGAAGVAGVEGTGAAALPEADNAIADSVAATSRRAWQRAADVGVTVGQGAAAVGVSVGERAVDVGQATANLAAKTPVVAKAPVRGTLGAGASVGHGARRVGAATGGFFTRVASSISKALP
jgi:pyruvate dehydrogenase E2 component (dihydrolipoamide acetyltransferase)